jgi:hypothetical protein
MKTFFIYLSELIVAVILLWIDQRLFFLYAFILAMYSIDRRFNELLETNAVQYIGVVPVIVAMAEHLNVPEEKIIEMQNQFRQDYLEAKKFSWMQEIELKSKLGI